jgi:glucan phosphorylase
MNRMQAILPAVLISLLIVAPCAAANAPKEVTLQVTELDSSYQLSVPVSQLIMTIPKGNFLQKNNAGGGSADSPRYFYFEDKKQGMIASGWFESSEGYSNFSKLWNDEKKSWQSNNLPMPTNETIFKSDGWEAVAYDIPVPLQAGNNSHIRAYWVQAGTWIDLHLSLTSKAENVELREKLTKLLKSIQIKQRP